MTREDCISRAKAIEKADNLCLETGYDNEKVIEMLNDLPSVTPKEKTWHCKDCKWWKDNDGVYRRGARAESKCPINRKEVYEGNGYCFLFEPQESEDNE